MAMGSTFMVGAMAIGLAGLVRRGYELVASAGVLLLLALAFYMMANSLGL
ncbi:MAG: hypothetical protein JOZ37_15110 [Actinobacteria bacterium]|nr:hypothetical protein [Actinomycetota bacterium]MBV9253926.1 hypothetical protein [Actinomycetota bacterium]MBV9665295.1 hypothetical protein [Actinomycetota bacterium]MBV9935033.1 hypothetical protein [Actinomycetota bacterium]